MKHVKLNGVWYRLAEDAEGTHYNKTLAPLRPPNSQVVQGDQGTFQLRPDILLWRQKNWSGGEGQIKFDPQEPDRAFTIQHADPFSKPGTVRSSAQMLIAQNDVAGNVGDGYLVIAIGGMYWVDATSIRAWAGSNFGAASTITGASGAAKAPVGDRSYLFVHEAGTDNIRRYNGSTWTLLNNQCADASGGVMMAELGSYVYIWAPATGKVYEISKATVNTTTAEVEIYTSPANSALDTDRALLVAGDNRVYLAVHDDQKTTVHEITPTSAAGTGFGAEIATMYGVTPEALFYAGGTIFMIGHDETPDDTVGPDRQIFYIDPAGSYGTLGSVRGLYDDGVTTGPSAHPPYPAYGAKLGKMAFVLASNTDTEDSDDTKLDLWELDQITGGYACVAGDGALLSTASNPKALVFWQGKYFASDATHTVYWDLDDMTGDNGKIVSVTNDFDLAGEKILESIEVICDPVPSGGDITVGYILDGGTEVTSALSLSANDTGGKLTISTDAATKTFREMQYTITLTGTNKPVLRAVNVYARVNRRIRIWDLMLDASDDAAPQGFSGAQIIDNITGLADNTVIDFVDAYGSHVHGSEAAAADVVVDQANVVLSQQGEGIIQVRLMEVV